MGKAAFPHVIGNRLDAPVGADPLDRPEVATVSIVHVANSAGHRERPLVQQFLEFRRCALRQGDLRIALAMNLRRIDANYPYFALAELERVAIDDACVSPPRPAA